MGPQHQDQPQWGTMLIVDAQVHIWAANTAERPWPARHAPHQPVPICCVR